MSKVSNMFVPRAWSCGQEAKSHTGNYWTDGRTLYSYSLMIGDTTAQGTKVLRDYTSNGKWGFQSQTTSCHVGRAKQHADLID